MDKFKNFLRSIESESNKSLIEAISSAYSILHEGPIIGPIGVEYDPDDTDTEHGVAHRAAKRKAEA